MNWFDYLLLIILILSILGGFGRGFIREILSLLTWIAAFIIATLFSHTLAAVFTSSASVQNVIGQASDAIGVNAAQPVSYVAIAISYAVLFLGTVIAGSILSFFLNAAFQIGVLGLANRLL